MWIKSAVATVVLGGLALGGCSSSDKLLGSDGSNVMNAPSGGAGGSPSVGPRLGLVGVLKLGSADACLDEPFVLDGSSPPDCYLAVLRQTSSCDCSGAGLSPSGINGSDPYTADAFKQQGWCGNDGQPACSDYCACTVQPLSGAELTHCQGDTDPVIDGTGWCYVSTPAGDSAAALPSECTTARPQTLRVVGEAAPQAGDLIVYSCSHVLPPLSIPEQAPAAVGEPCIASDEWSPYFSGYSAAELNVDDRAPQCESNICLVNHFQGRASCPYGQAAGAGDCLLPDGSKPVKGKVSPQLEARQAAVASICSCRCDGDGPGPYCTCPESMQCEHLVDDLGLGTPELAGSYCIPKGSKYDAAQLSSPVCIAPNCGPAHPN